MSFVALFKSTPSSSSNQGYKFVVPKSTEFYRDVKLILYKDTKMPFGSHGERERGTLPPKYARTLQSFGDVIRADV